MKKLTLESFTGFLLDSGDLDPVVGALEKAKLPKDQLCRWLLAYWLFFHAGSASYLSERTGDEFWKVALQAAANTPPPPVPGWWPRGSERRYMRGQKAETTVEHLRKFFGAPEGFVTELLSFHHTEIQREIDCHFNFGPWVALRARIQLQHLFRLQGHVEAREALQFRKVVRGAMKASEPWATRRHKKDERVLRVVDSLSRYDGRLSVGDAILAIGRWKGYVTGSYRIGDFLGRTKHDLLVWEGASETSKTLFATLNTDYP